METKTGLAIAGTFVLGIGIGFGVGYLVSKKSCEIHTQQAIDEMKAEHKKELEDIKNSTKETGDEEKKEEEVVKIDKPSIMEMSSIVSSYSNDNSNPTKYSFTQLKEKIKESQEKQKQEGKVWYGQSVIDYSKYMEIDEGYSETTFTFDTDTETWSDMNVGASYEDLDDLPFDPEMVVWTDDQCYILDEESKCIYELQKV